MKYKITTNYKPLTLAVTIKTTKPTKLQVCVYDAMNKMRRFTDRYKTIDGQETLYVRMPLSPEVAVVDVYNSALGQNIPKDKETSFEIISVKKAPLERKLDEGDIANGKIRSFIDFAQKFCFNVGELAPNTYKSDDARYFIRLSQQIKDESGKVMNTPARVGRKTGIIEVSKDAFSKFTIPMRLAILFHEFSHYYLNEQINDEMEADLNGLLIYLSLGYPRIEAYQAFLETFQGTPTKLNKSRYDLINKFINDFDKMNMVIK